MIKYLCDRCKRDISSDQFFKVRIEPPEVWIYGDPLVEYEYGEFQFCSRCMKKLMECIEEEKTDELE